jgi:hypothetical protein
MKFTTFWTAPFLQWQNPKTLHGWDSRLVGVFTR